MVEKYKTRFPESYEQGSINITIRISAVAFRLLEENVSNASAFLNDCVIQELRDGEHRKREAFSALNNAVERMRKIGKDVIYDVRDINATNTEEGDRK